MNVMVMLAAMLCGQSIWASWASFRVLVLDSETDAHIKGIKIEGSFLNHSRGWGISAKDNDVDTITDTDGMAKLSGSTEQGVGGYRIYGNSGYYNAEWKEISFSEQSLLRFGSWQPSDIVSTTRLDRIISPIPLFVQQCRGSFRQRKQSDYTIVATYKEMPNALLLTNQVHSVSNVLMCFDMVKGDWLPPMGKGDIADITFRFDEDELGWTICEGYSVSISKQYKMKALISFPGQGNGAVEIPYRQDAGIRLRTAPEQGYANGLSRWYGWFGGGDGTKTDCDKKCCLAFRIRTTYDNDGNVKEAYYGKIYGDFDLSSLAGVSFLYYLNPTPNDRNLEWDMKNNLCSQSGEIGEAKP